MFVLCFLTAHEVFVREYLLQTGFKHTGFTGSHHLCKKCHGNHWKWPPPVFCISVVIHCCVFLSPKAKVDNEILDYRDLAAIPKVKAIYDIERPDLITYEPMYTTSLDERGERLESVGEVKLHFCLRHIWALSVDRSGKSADVFNSSTLPGGNAPPCLMTK